MTLGLPGGPGVLAFSAEQPGIVAPDARDLPWPTLNRLALEAGHFPPDNRSLTGAELARLLEGNNSSEARWWRQHLLTRPGLRLGGRVLAGFSDLGDVVPGEAGLSWAPGWNTSLEPQIQYRRGRFWAAGSLRLNGRLADAGRQPDPGDWLAWPGWKRASGWTQVREARLKGSAWTLDAPRALVGAQLGRWSLTAGWAPRRTGPGVRGTLVLDQDGATFPALTARRTAPFSWSGIMTHAAPDRFLLRVGKLSTQTISYGDDWGRHHKRAEPWFFQWLMGWDVTRWFRTSFTHTVMATPREGTLWPDLLQINFPVIGTTWRETASGPITDRLFAVHLEFRWGESPLAVLPARAGRLYWDYGGTDFLPSGPWGKIPRISIPASVAGCELIGRHHDLVFEYAETFHDKVLWYTNSGYSEGYTHNGWLLAHTMGGGSEAFTCQVRLRPGFTAAEARLSAERINWNHFKFYGDVARRQTWRLEVLRPAGGSVIGDPRALPWKVVLELTTESLKNAGVEDTWWRSYVVLGF